MRELPEIDPSQQAKCPLCLGKGYDTTRSDYQSGATWGPKVRCTTIPSCQLCRGLGHIYMDKVCVCGWASVCYNAQEGVWYCGRMMCLAKKSQPKNIRPNLDEETFNQMY